MRRGAFKAGLLLPAFFLLLCLTVPVYAKYASVWTGSLRMEPALPALSLVLLEEEPTPLGDGLLEVRFAVSNREEDHLSDTALRYWIELSTEGTQPSMALFQGENEIPLTLTEGGRRSAEALLPAGMEQRDEYLLRLSGTSGGELRLTVSAEQAFPGEAPA